MKPEFDLTPFEERRLAKARLRAKKHLEKKEYITVEEYKKPSFFERLFKKKPASEKVETPKIETKKETIKETVKETVKETKKDVTTPIESETPKVKIKEGRPKASKGLFAFSLLTWIIIGIGVLAVIGGSIFAYKLLEGKPELNVDDLVAPNSSVLYDANGDKIIELGMYLRENIDYEEMPNQLIDAFLAIEDSRHFTHIGFDLPRFVKAAIANLKSGDFSQGGSTITMQLIKNTYYQLDANEESTIASRTGMSGLQRKMQEIVLAIELNQKMDKRDIIALFINKVNYGNNIRGVEKAAEYYFGKRASELNLAECAFLAGIINSPNNYNPYNDLYKDNESYIYLSSDIEYLENANERKNEVLNLMRDHGFITEEEAKVAKSVKIENLLCGIDDRFALTSDYFQSYIDAVIEEAIRVTGKDPYNVAMDIYTNMNPEMQKIVNDMQNERTEISYQNDQCQNAIVVLNNQTGELIALGGGRGQTESRMYNRATSAKLQPGSSIKTILEYPLAFNTLGWATSHTITDQPIFLYGGNVLVTNAGGQAYTGDMLLTEAVARSLNTPAVQALMAVIEEKDEQFVVDYLNSIGIETEFEDFDLQYAIGGNRSLLTPVENAAAHAINVNGGRYIEPHTISKIVYQDGSEYVADTKGNQVITPEAAWLTAYLEEYNVSGSFFNYMQILRRDYPVYAKTGTTDWAASGVQYGIPTGSIKDEWIVASTSNYTVCTWLGFDKLEEGSYFTAYYDSLNIKGKIAKYLLDSLEEVIPNYEPTDIPVPDGITTVSHVKGAYPYCYPTGGYETVTGYIAKKSLEERPLTSVDEVLSNLEVKVVKGSVSGINGSVGEDNIARISISGSQGGSSGVGVVDLSATNVFGRTYHCTGRSYFPHYIYEYTAGDEVVHVYLEVNGEYFTGGDAYDGYIEFGDVPEGRVRACAYSDSSDTICKTIRS